MGDGGCTRGLGLLSRAARRHVFAALLLSIGSSAAFACGSSSTRPLEHSDDAAPSWCSAVDRALARSGEHAFRCLQVPNYLVTGFYGSERNPERSDFLNGCFGGHNEAAERLRMTVRPSGDLSLAFSSERRVSAGSGIDLGFLGPWAPELAGTVREAATFGVSVELKDSEVRVLPSVPEILGQQYLASETEPERREILERCITTLCEERPNETLVYTTKVLAAVPVIEVKTAHGNQSTAGVKLASVAGFEVAGSEQSARALVIRAREKLNVAALVEPARAAFEAAGTCQLVQGTRTRRQGISGLRELGLRTLAGRDLAGVAVEAQRLRPVLGSEAFTGHEQGDLLAALEALEFASRAFGQAALPNGVCETISMLGRVLTGGGDNRVHETILEVAEPLHRRLLDLANTHSLPCAELAWYQDADGDGYGNELVRRRGGAPPAGFVANSLDCFDRNADVHPGQRKHFARQRGDGSFDYDCDGQQAPQKDLLAGGCRSITRFGLPIRCWADMGWRDKIPSCGETGHWLADCVGSTFACEEPDERLERQACR